MRKMVAMLLAVVVGLTLATMVVAQEQKTEKPKMQVLTGEVVSVDAAAKTITVKTKDKDVTLTLAADAKVMIHGKAGSLDQITAGEHVTVKYEEKEGAQVAQEIVTAKAPAKKG